MPAVLVVPGTGDSQVVAVPGLGLSVEIPARTLTLLRSVAGATVVALPGYGLPASPGTALDPVSLAGRLVEQLDTLKVARAVLFGHSASCQVVAHVAVHAPDRVSGLVLVGPTTDPRASSWPRLAARWLRTAASERPHQVPVLVRNYRHTGLAAMLRAMDAARRDRLDHTVAQVCAPVLVVRGRHDRIVPADWAGTIADAAPRGRAVTLWAGAHMVPFTHPRLLARQLQRFIATTQLGRRTDRS